MSNLLPLDTLSNMSSSDPIQVSSAIPTDQSAVRRPTKMPETEKEVGQPSDTVSNASAPSRAFQTSQTVAKLLKGEEKLWSAVAEKQGPLHLLDLPVVILKEIVKEVWRSTYSADGHGSLILAGHPHE